MAWMIAAWSVGPDKGPCLFGEAEIHWKACHVSSVILVDHASCYLALIKTARVASLIRPLC